MSRRDALVTTEWAHRHLDTEGVVFVETGNSDLEYRRAHLPGAVWIGWDELQDSLRLGVVNRQAFAELMSRHGIGAEDRIVVYSSPMNLLAALLYWYLAYYGHRTVALLDGGRAAWTRERRPTSRDPVARPAAAFRVGGPDATVRAHRVDVLGAVGTATFLDVRTPEEYRGETFAPAFAGPAFAPGNNPHEVAQRSGHIPGAVNIPWDTALAADETFRAEAELRSRYAALTPGREVITYCWVGARSAHTWFVLSELLGVDRVRNYDGSWAEYGSLIDVPVARDDEERGA